MHHFGRILIGLGLILIITGAVVILLDKAGLSIGKLPGDIVYQKGRTTIYLPIATSVLLSLLLTIIFWIFRR